MSILNGKTLLEHAIISAVKADCISHIIISSESQSVIDFAKSICCNYNSNFLFHIRDPQAHINPVDIVYSCLQYLDSINHVIPDLSFFLAFTLPFVRHI